jgi:hypothetical protein
VRETDRRRAGHPRLPLPSANNGRRKVRPAQAGIADLCDDFERHRNHQISDLLEDRTQAVSVRSDGLHLLITLSVTVTQLLRISLRLTVRRIRCSGALD